jgi:hypothetical protein
MAGHAVHPQVAAPKFDREMAQFRAQTSRMREHGVLLLDVTPPAVLVAFAAPQLQPAGIVVAVMFDFTDFDLQPPSVTFVHAFTGERLRLDQMHTQMVRGIEQPLQLPEGMQSPPDGNPFQPTVVVPQPLIQAHDGGWPFLCLPGVREYHAHPGHTGDPWELHRTTGAGSLVRLIDTIRKYAVEPIQEWGVQLIPRVGFNQGPPPA